MAAIIKPQAPLQSLKLLPTYLYKPTLLNDMHLLRAHVRRPFDLPSTSKFTMSRCTITYASIVS